MGYRVYILYKSEYLIQHLLQLFYLLKNNKINHTYRMNFSLNYLFILVLIFGSIKSTYKLYFEIFSFFIPFKECYILIKTFIFHMKIFLISCKLLPNQKILLKILMYLNRNKVGSFILNEQFLSYLKIRKECQMIHYLICKNSCIYSTQRYNIFNIFIKPFLK